MSETRGPDKPSSLQSLLQTIESVDKSSFRDDGERSKAVLAAYALVSKLESPWETICRLVMAQPALGASLKIAGDLGLFKKWHERGDGALTHKELAELTQCNGLLIHRVVRNLAANHMLEEVSLGTYKQTAFSLALLQPAFGESINWLYETTMPSFSKMPEYLAKTGYMSPFNPTDGVFQYTKASQGTLFDYYSDHPQEGNSFNHFMSGVMAHQAGWLDIYPHERFLENTVGKESAILVDIGGGLGHDLERFRAAHPEVADRLILQDRPEVVTVANCPDPVQKMSYDFFTPQPVKGARAYYMHTILHDWSDEPARKILAMLKPAMEPGYSTLLIHDHVLAEEHPHPQATAYDMTMMALVAALERSEAMWRELLDSAGYRVIKIWSSDLMTMSVIEAEVA